MMRIGALGDLSLEFLKNEEGFFTADNSVGFLLGCVKKLVLRLEKLEVSLKVKT